MFGLTELPKRRLFRIGLRGVFIIVGAIAAYIVSILVQEKQYYWGAVAAFVVLGTVVGEFIFADVITERRFPQKTQSLLEAYERKIRKVHNPILELVRQAIDSLRACDPSTVNGTVHLVVEVFSPIDDKAANAFVQLTEYTGGLGGKRWRFSDPSKGIIGRCLRTGSPEYVNFATQSEFNKRMVGEFGFTSVEMRDRTLTARSYWAHPLLSHEEFIGVLFLFSTQPQVFPLAADKSVLDQTCRNIVGILEAADIM